MNTEKTLFGLLVRFLRPGKKLMFFVVLQYVIDVLGLTLIPPVMQQVFTDNIITGKNPEWFVPFVIVYILVLAFGFIAWWACVYRRNTLRAHFSMQMNVKYIWHALRLPMDIIGKITPGEIVSRLQRGQMAAARIVNDLMPTMVYFFELILMFGIMIMYCWELAIVAIISVFVSVSTMLLTSKYQKKIARWQENTQRQLQNVTMTSIQNMDTVKSMGAEMSLFSGWQGMYVRALNSRVKANTTIIQLGLVPVAAQVFGSAIVLLLGCRYILLGMITPGVLLAFQGFMAFTIYPILVITRSMQTLFSSHAALELMENVTDVPCSVSDNLIDNPDDLSAPYKLSGRVDLNHITYGYDRSMPPLLNDFSLHIEPGQSVALVGLSGCGKSTIAKLISGLYESWEGEVLFDGKKMGDIPRAIFTNSVSVINQDIVLFEGTVADNIKMWDESIEDFSMVFAAYSAQIHDAIAMREGAYKGDVIDGGKNFSGGQRQRIEIAAALAKEPTILIMDEATSALDTATEEKVMTAIRNLGITTIIIAHRLSTIRDCDRILVMEYGKVLQEGTHDELLEDKNGLYYKLNNA